MGILLAIQLTNASISFYELNKAGNAIAALKSSLKPSATVKRDGKWKVINATEVVPGDVSWLPKSILRTFKGRISNIVLLTI